MIIASDDLQTHIPCSNYGEDEATDDRVSAKNAEDCGFKSHKRAAIFLKGRFVHVYMFLQKYFYHVNSN